MLQSKGGFFFFSSHACINKLTSPGALNGLSGRVHVPFGIDRYSGASPELSGAPDSYNMKGLEGVGASRTGGINTDSALSSSIFFPSFPLMNACRVCWKILDISEVVPSTTRKLYKHFQPRWFWKCRPRLWNLNTNKKIWEKITRIPRVLLPPFVWQFFLPSWKNFSCISTRVLFLPGPRYIYNRDPSLESEVYTVIVVARAWLWKRKREQVPPSLLRVCI